MEVSSHPYAVEFDEVECCAMQRASIQEAHQPLIREYMAHIGEIHPVYRASLLLGVFKDVFYVTFVPHKGHCMLYASLAAAEKNILEQKQNENFTLDCEHTIQQHCGALDMVVAKMAFSQEIVISVGEQEAMIQTKIPSVRLNRKMNFMAGGLSPVPRVTHRKAHRKKSARFKITCGCCDHSFDIYYDNIGNPTQAFLEIADVNADVKNWRAILLPLLGFERQGDAWVDTYKENTLKQKE